MQLVTLDLDSSNLVDFPAATVQKLSSLIVESLDLRTKLIDQKRSLTAILNRNSLHLGQHLCSLHNLYIGHLTIRAYLLRVNL